MRHQKKTIILSRKTAARKALLRTLAVSLILHGSITTTPAKAKAVQSFLEPLIAKGKEKSVHNIRLAIKILANAAAARTLVGQVAPRYKLRKGGYTRLVKISPRSGDGASQVRLEFV